METRTYTERSNARRAARAAGLDPDAAIIETEDGFEVRFEPREQHKPKTITDDTWPRHADGSRKKVGEMTTQQQVAVAAGAVARLTSEFAAQGVAIKFAGLLCGYPSCKCIVQTSTSQPEPVCPKGLDREPPPIKQAVEAAIECGIGPKEFVKIAEGVADALDGIPEFCKIAPEKRKESWIKNPPKVAAANLKEAIAMAKTKTKEKKPKGQTGSDKTATLLSMLKGKGSTVEAMTKALDWLPHTLRARISRLPKDDKKIKIERERVDGVTSYRIAS